MDFFYKYRKALELCMCILHISPNMIKTNVLELEGHIYGEFKIIPLPHDKDLYETLPNSTQQIQPNKG